MPEPDAAEEIFAQARSEPDLRRRAALWRAEHGLPPAPTTDPPLAEVDPEDLAHALRHRRRTLALRRRRPWIYAAAALVVVAAAVARAFTPGGAAFGGFSSKPVTSPATDIPFLEAPLASDLAGDLRLAGYRIEASPVTVTLWWELSGPHLPRKGEGLQPELQTPDSAQWLATTATLTAPAGPERLRGRTTWPVQVTRLGTALVRLRAADGKAWSLSLPLAATPSDPEDPMVRVHQTQQGDHWGITVIDMTLGSGYTAIRYQLNSGPATLPPPTLQTATGESHSPRAVWPLAAGTREYVAVFDGDLPPGSDWFDLRFPAPAAAPIVYTASVQSLLSDLHRQGQAMTGTLRVPAPFGVAPEVTDAGLIAADGRTYAVELAGQPGDYSLRALVPEGVALVNVTLTLLAAEPPLRFHLPLVGERQG